MQSSGVFENRKKDGATLIVLLYIYYVNPNGTDLFSLLR